MSSPKRSCSSASGFASTSGRGEGSTFKSAATSVSAGNLSGVAMTTSEEATTPSPGVTTATRAPAPATADPDEGPGEIGDLAGLRDRDRARAPIPRSGGG